MRYLKLFSVFAIVLWWGGCQHHEEVEPPAPPSSPPTTTPPEPTIPPGEKCALPDTGRGERGCYVTRARAGTRREKAVLSTGLLRDMMFADQELIATSRNFTRVSLTCSARLGKTVPPFFVRTETLTTLAERGFVLHDGGREIEESRTIVHPSMLSFIGEGEGIGRLQRPHRNCTEDDEVNPWCGRTGVFRPILEHFREGVAEHMSAMRRIDGRANHLGFDGIGAWCAAQ